MRGMDGSHSFFVDLWSLGWVCDCVHGQSIQIFGEVNPFSYFFLYYFFFWGGGHIRVHGPVCKVVHGPSLYFYLFLTQTIIIITYINIIIIFENTCLNCSQEKSFAQKLLAGTPALFTPIVVSLWC